MKTRSVLSPLWMAIVAGAALESSGIQVTYQVNMGVQMSLGNFNPGNGDTVFVAGNFATTNGTWLQTATDGSTNYILAASVGNTNIYAGTFSITNDPGTFENHQFVINPGGNFAGTLIWEPGISGGGNRFFTVPTVNTNLPVVFFNDVSNVNQQVTEPVSFYVDMSIQQAVGNFDPNSDFVVVAGDWMGGNWANALNSAPSMTPTGTNALVYTGTLNLTNTVGAIENYKFVILSQNLGTEWEGNVGPNGGVNRQFVFPGAATNLPTAFFNNTTNVSSDIPVVFQVNLLVENALGMFTPGSDSVDVAGDFNNWSVTANPLTQTADPNVYSGNVTMHGFSTGATLNYKFTINGQSLWELNGVGPNGAQNHQITLPAYATNYSLYFNNYTNLGLLSVTNNHAGQVVLKWPLAGSRTRLQSSSNLAVGWQDVPNTVGANSITSNITGQNFYRVKGP